MPQESMKSQNRILVAQIYGCPQCHIELSPQSTLQQRQGSGHDFSAQYGVLVHREPDSYDQEHQSYSCSCIHRLVLRLPFHTH